MKFCPKCGKQVAARAKFCRACGANIAPTEAPPVLTPPLLSKNPPVIPGGAAVVATEEEIAPPPPPRGFQSTWGRDAQGRVAPVVEPPSGSAPAPGAPAVAAPSAGNLPAAPSPWKFREQTGAWAGVPDNVIGRVVRGALMHRDVYRDAASRGELTTEAILLAGVVLVAGFASVLFLGWFTATLLARMAVVRIAGWVCAVWAIQLSAKSMTQVDLPFIFWFRALAYAQVPLLLSAVPFVGIAGVIWAAVCTAAAIHDLTGRDTGTAIIITVIGGVASYLAVAVVGAVLP